MKKLKFHGDGIITGIGSLKALKDMEFEKVFVVTGGSSMFKNGTIEKIKGMVESKGKEVYIFSGIHKNPDTEEILKGIEEMKKFNPDTVLGVGGGSSIDAAKVMALFYEYPELDFDNAVKRPMPKKRYKVKFIAVPSTSGTATEVTKAAVVTFREKSLKIGLKTEAFVPDITILDGELTLSMPDNVVAETGMDALTHAVECYINKSSDDFTDSIAKGAVEGIMKYLPLSYVNKDIESRQKMHNYQCLAGMAFTNAGLGMSHGIAHAFGGRYDMGHGLLNAIILPYAIDFNSRDESVRQKIGELERATQKDNLAKAVRELNKLMHIPASFKEAGLKREAFDKDFELLVDNSLMGSTRVNPVKVTREDMKHILECIYEGKEDI
jgi:alcohol dehydrogenase class IV